MLGAAAEAEPRGLEELPAEGKWVAPFGFFGWGLLDPVAALVWLGFFSFVWIDTCLLIMSFEQRLESDFGRDRWEVIRSTQKPVPFRVQPS